MLELLFTTAQPIGDQSASPGALAWKYPRYLQTSKSSADAIRTISTMLESKKRKLNGCFHTSSEAPKKRAKHIPSPTNDKISSKPSSAPASAPAAPVTAEETEAAKETNGSAPKSFQDLEIIDSLCEACTALGYRTATPIQSAAIPLALQGRDLIGLAETGSGKTAAFALPILQGELVKGLP